MLVDNLGARGLLLRNERYEHDYPHCWRCGTALLFRVVDEWYISMGEVYDTPRAQLTEARVRGNPLLPLMDPL